LKMKYTNECLDCECPIEADEDLCLRCEKIRADVTQEEMQEALSEECLHCEKIRGDC